MNTKSIKSSLFADKKMTNLNVIKGGTKTATTYKTGQKDSSDSADNDQCWTVGSSDTAACE